MEGSPSTPTRPIHAIVQHYTVLYSNGIQKKRQNRQYHDGALTHHLFNGKMILMDESGHELEQHFHNSNMLRPNMVLNGAAPHLDEGDEIEMENYLVEIKTFRRVTRVDVTEIVSPLGKSGKGKTLNPLPLGADPRDGRGRYESAEQPLRRKRRDPIERPHTFVTPFKSRVASDPISESPPRLGGPVAEYASPTDPGGKPRKRRLGCSPRAELGLPSKRSHRPREDE